MALDLEHDFAVPRAEPTGFCPRRQALRPSTASLNTRRSVHDAGDGKAMQDQVNRLRTCVGPLWPFLLLIAIPAAGFIIPDLIGGHFLLSGDNAATELPIARAGGQHAPARPAPLLGPLHLQRFTVAGRIQRGCVLPTRGTLRDPARSGCVDRARSHSLLRSGHRDVRLPAGARPCQPSPA